MTRGSPSVVRSSVLRYLATSLAVLAVIGLSTAVLASRVALNEALRGAQETTRKMADGLAAPLVTAAVRAGDPRALRRLGRALAHRMQDGSVTHIVVYTGAGHVLWADNQRIRGADVELEDDVAALAGTHDTIVDEPGEREMHPWSEPGDGRLIEVYAGARGADGAPFVFEAYLSPAHIAEDQQAIFVRLAPLVLGVMLLFLLATLPFALALARQVDRAAATRSDLLVRSVAALGEERRRLAQVLHDGVIQDLSAAGYALSALADPAPGPRDSEAAMRRSAARIEALVHDDLRQLRGLVGDLFPADREEHHLVAALSAMRSRSAERFGLDVQLELSGVDDLDAASSSAVFRVVREGLANVGNHAEATRVVVNARRTGLPGRPGDGVVVTVIDDGVGVSANAAPRTAEPEGRGEHMGLRLLSRQLDRLGGSVEVVRADGGGTVLTAWIPVAGEDLGD